MNEDFPATIDPHPPAHPGLDFFRLKREGTALVQALSGQIWTDYNEHDPGVTTLEQLAYALTELSYRSELPVADFLTRADGEIDAERQALYPAAAIFTCNPVTIADYRKLLVDRIEALANVWLDKVPWSADGAVGGLYRIAAYARELDVRCDRDRVDAVARDVWEVYAAHRDLCEDLAEVVVLTPLRVEVYGDVVVGDAAAAEEILAEIYFRLGNTLAPELRRRSLDDLLARGEAPEEIFDGPLLLHGFIDDDELRPKAPCFTARGLARVIQSVEGVTGVREVRILSPEAPDEQCLDVPDDQIPELFLRAQGMPPGGSKDELTLRLWCRGVPLCPDTRRVERLLRRRWAVARRTYPLWPPYDQAFAMPRGRRRDFAAYESIQSQYPVVYGIGPEGLPETSTEIRQGQARQLKGYLLAFEQQLTDFFAQLAHVKDLFSVDAGLEQTYFSQPLDRSVPDVAPLLRPPSADSPGYLEGLQELVASQDPFVARRERFLDLLLALYGEHLDADEIWGGSEAESSSCSELSPGEPPGARRIRAKIELLRRLVAATAERGRAVDVSGSLGPENHAGMQIRLRVQLGFPALPPPPLGERLDELGVELVEPEARASLGRSLGRRGDEVESAFEPVRKARLGRGETRGPEGEEGLEIVLEPDRGDAVKPPLAGQSLHAELVEAAADLENLRLGVFAGESEHAVVCRCPAGGGEWRLLERCADHTRAWIAACAWEQAMGELAAAMQQLYLVEHVLLRFAETGAALTSFDYSFTLSAVVSAPPPTLRDVAWRDFVRQATRAATPAHLALRVVFVGPVAMCHFESLYWAWRRALRCPDDAEARRVTSIALRDWLIDHQRDAGASGGTGDRLGDRGTPR